MSLKVASGVLAAAVAPSGNFTVSYPSGTNPGSFSGGVNHKLVTSPQNDVYNWTEHFTLTFGASSITVTLQSTFPTTLAAGTGFYLQLDMPGANDDRPTLPASIRDKGVAMAFPVFINLGVPTTTDVDGLRTAVAVGGAGAVALSGALVSGGVGTFDVPRCVQVVSSNAGDTSQVITITGKDAYGVTMSQALTLNGTTPVIGTKAFKTVTALSASASMAGNLSVGDSNVLGIPVFVPGTGHIFAEILDGVAATAGTKVAGVTTKPSTTTGDVRGTYNPNSAPNGSRSYQLGVMVPDPSFLGMTQA